ncbi:MAG: hypothetical protein QOH96_2057 [Blastocatellia bacterium]|nr:hypothetical protein [Blastocatellia bacterium]
MLAEDRLVALETIASAPLETRQKLEFTYDYIGRRIQTKVYAWNAVFA